jgi:DNA-binding MarR family transcriptional regulator
VRAFERAAEDEARAAGLTPQRHLLLLMTKGAPDGSERATVGALAERLKLAPHTVTGAIRRAEQAGLVARQACTQDRRRTWVRLTPEGERRLERTVGALRPQREALVAAIESFLAGPASRATALRRDVLGNRDTT